MKKLLGTLLFAVTGCSTGGGNYASNYHNPELFRCPSSHFAMCEGNSPTTMECQCVDRQYQRNVIRSIRGVL